MRLQLRHIFGGLGALLTVLVLTLTIGLATDRLTITDGATGKTFVVGLPDCGGSNRAISYTASTKTINCVTVATITTTTTSTTTTTTT